MNRPAVICTLLLAGLLAGCATGPRPIPDERERAWQRIRSELVALEQWRADGRLVVRAPDGGGQAHFTWRETPDRGYSLQLGGPWGQRAARLTGTASRVELLAADGRRFVGPDARELLLAVYGWDIPVEALREWLIGLPTNGSEYRLDRYGRVASLQWQDWSLEYRRYRQRDGIDLPAVLAATRGRDGVELRVAVDQWQLGSESTPAPDSPVPLIGG